MSDMNQCKEVDMSFFDTAPFLFANEVELDCTPDRLFDIFEDDHSWTVWAGPIEKVEWTSPKPFGVGTTRTVTMKGDQVGDEIFIAWERGKRMAFRFTKANIKNVLAFGEDYIITDLGNGRCRFKWIVAMELGGINKFLLKVFGPLLSMQFRGFLKKLQKYVVENPS